MAKIEVTFSIYVSDVLYDIRNRTAVTARSRRDGNNHELTAAMHANEDEEAVNANLRSVRVAWQDMRRQLSEYIVEDEDDLHTSNVLQFSDEDLATSTLTQTLTLPTNYNMATRGAIAQCMHQFLVNNALFDWFQMTDKADAADYKQLAVENIQNIRDAINRRLPPTRSAIERDTE